MIVLITVLYSVPFGQGCSATSAAGKQQVKSENKNESSPVDEVLAKLNERGKTLTSYQCKLAHLVEQPLFESRSLRTGELFYYRGKDQSLLRIDFNTLKQDDEPREKYVEQFIFDGVWLTRIDHQLKEIKKYQLVDINDVDPNEGVDAFDLISEYLPIVGLTDADKLNSQFDIELAEPNENAPDDVTMLHMKVKADSVYKDDWVWIDFWIDEKIDLPVRMVTLTTEDDIYTIRFLDAKVNELQNTSVFDVKMPKRFNVTEVVPLDRKK